MLCNLCIYCSEFGALPGCFLWFSAGFSSTERNTVHMKEAIMNLPLGELGFFMLCF